MTRFAAMLAFMLAACQQASTPSADNAAANTATANVAVNAAEHMPPFAETTDAHPTAPEAAPIPAKFRGIWAESRAVCAQLSHPSRLIISGRTIRYPAFVLEGESVSLLSAESFAIKGRNKRTEAPAEAHFLIDPTGLVLTDEAGGGTVRVKCG